MSRHAKPLAKLPREQQAETEELNNLLYSLHSTPVMDQIGLSKIAKETSADKTLCKIKKYIQNGQGWIPKDEPHDVQRFKQILPELTITGNGIILKDDRIVLPVSLQQNAIELAHRDAHPGQSGMERRHFFFHDMYKLVEKFESVRPVHCLLRSQGKRLSPIIRYQIAAGRPLLWTCTVQCPHPSMWWWSTI